MPRGDGTGPTGSGPGTGGGTCLGRGQGGGKGKGGMGRRRCGIGGECICPQCGMRAPHERGTPCIKQKCPQCGATMVRA